jgi:hypothetical protein
VEAVDEGVAVRWSAAHKRQWVELFGLSCHRSGRIEVMWRERRRGRVTLEESALFEPGHVSALQQRTGRGSKCCGSCIDIRSLERRNGAVGRAGHVISDE